MLRSEGREGEEGKGAHVSIRRVLGGEGQNDPPQSVEKREEQCRAGEGERASDAWKRKERAERKERATHGSDGGDDLRRARAGGDLVVCLDRVAELEACRLPELLHGARHLAGNSEPLELCVEGDVEKEGEATADLGRGLPLGRRRRAARRGGAVVHLRHDEIAVRDDERVPFQRHRTGVGHGARFVRAQRCERGLDFAQVAAQLLPHAAEVELKRRLAVKNREERKERMMSKTE